MVYRNYSKGFIWQHGKAFSDQSNAVNESGLYLGFIMKPKRKITVSSYIDVFKLPWYSFSADGPNRKNEVLLEIRYVLSKKTIIYFF